MLVGIMRDGGVLNPAFEGHYKDGWMNPAVVAKTHPIFHVEPNGDLVFHKETRGEYLKWNIQRRFKTSAAWWWREYLRPPAAAQTVREWAKEKLKEMRAGAKNWQPQPGYRLQPEPAKSRSYR